MRAHAARALCLAGLLAGARTAAAQVCVASSTGLVFGVYDPLAAAPAAITGTITVSCQTTVTVGVAYAIQIGPGMGGSVGMRTMSAGAGRLSYQLYTDAARTIVWGDGLAGSGTVSDAYTLAALGNAQRIYTVYGRLPARQVVPPGIYNDVVTVLISY